MSGQIKPVEAVSLKDASINQLENLILAGEFKPGERLPSERELAAQMGISRPVLHQAILALDAKGLVQIAPRKGVFVSDFRKNGSIALLTTLMTHAEGSYQPKLLRSLMAARMLIEVECANLAATQRTRGDLEQLEFVLDSGQILDPGDIHSLVHYDFAFHQTVAQASGNMMYILIINSLKSVHTNLAGEFYRAYASTDIRVQVLDFHTRLVNAISTREAEHAARIMRQMLAHGETHLLQILPKA